MFDARVLTPDCSEQILQGLPDKRNSRQHREARVQGKCYVEDMKSRNGTYVNNQEVSAAVQLKDNDRIKICDNLIAFQEAVRRPALPDDMRKASVSAEEEEETSSTVEASINQSS